MSLVLNGSTQYAFRNTPVLFSFGYPFTVMGWFNSTSVADLQAIWGESESSTGVNFWRLSARGNAVGDPIGAYGRGGGGTMDCVTTSGYSAGSWNNATLIGTSFADHKVYRNGGSEGQSVIAINPSGMDKMAIGALPYSGSFVNLFSGMIAEVAVWNVVLSSAERAQIMAGYPPTQVQSDYLVAYWPLLNDGDDASGNGYDLSLQGSPSFDPSDHPLAYNKSLFGGIDFPEAKTDMPDALDQFGCVADGGLVYVVGGVNNDTSEGLQGTHQKTTYVYDPDLDSWSQKADLPIALQSPCLRAVGGKLYCIGGYNSYLGTKYDTVYEYDPDLDSWATKTAMPNAREDAASAVVAGKIYVFGGLENGGHVIVSFIDVYDPATDTWEASRPWASPRALGDYGVASNGKVYLVSATDDMGGYSADLRTTAIVNSYTPDTDTFDTLTSCLIGACYKEIVEVEGVLYTFGGVTDDLTDFVEKYQLYDVGADKWLSFPAVDYDGGLGVGMAECLGSVFFGGGNQGGGNDRVADFYKILPSSLTTSSAQGTLSKGSPTPPPADPVTYRILNMQLDLDRA